MTDLAPTAHHFAGPSAWERVNVEACPGSVALSEGAPELPSPSAIEGTAAHELAAWCLIEERTADERLGQTIAVPYTEPYTDKACVEEVKVDREMVYEVNRYCDYVRNLGGWQYYEQRVSLDPFVPGGFGTSDAIAVVELADAPGKALLHVADLKYGRSPLGRVDVGTPEEPNGQLAQYALGAFNLVKERNVPLEIAAVRLHVCQPRLDHWATLDLTADQLLAFGEQRVKPSVAAWADPQAPRRPSDAACVFCRAKVKCPDLAGAVLHTVFEDIPQRRLRNVDNLVPEQMPEYLGLVNMIRRWCDTLEGHALSLAQAGHHIDGYKLVRGRANRKWIDDNKILGKIISRVKKYGLGKKDVMTEPELQSPAQIEALVKQIANLQEFEARFGKLVTKPEGKLALAPEDDPREAVVVEGFQPVADEQTEGGAAGYPPDPLQTSCFTGDDPAWDFLSLSDDEPEPAAPAPPPADYDPLALD